VLNILKGRKRSPVRRNDPPTDFWRMDFGPVDEPLVNGHTEAISLRTTERISFRARPRALESTPGRTSDRSFDWQSVQPPEPAIDLDETPPDDRRDPISDDWRTPPSQHRDDAERDLDRVSPGRARLAARPLAAVEAGAGTLTVQGVEKSFAGRKVVRGVSLSVRRGEAVGLLGPNGAGKTTVFYMITGLIKADRGHIQFDGYDITQLPMYQRARLGIGYLPQEASIFRGLNVEDNIRAVLEVVEPDRKRRERELDALLEEFNIERLRKTPSIALSGGERRRTEIARALATRPAYMLLDEPFAGIDPIAVGDIQALVRHLTERDIGVLITDHNVRETLGLTDRAYIIYSGEVLREGDRDEIINDPEVRRLYLGEEFSM
jgi:lipopolysaccharide export system ATP-binding protein